ncbi:MAG: TolC family protein [Candidatus Latescibacterota bacterium]
MKKSCGLILLFFAFCVQSAHAEPLTLTCEEAVGIALDKSFTVQSFEARRKAMLHYFDYYRAQFKPRIDFSVFAPTLRESVAPIQRADGLPVYNSTGLLQAGGDLAFTYMLPTGGNFKLRSQLYRENLTSVLALREYQKLRNRQAYSSLSLSFTQPVLTDNTIRENLRNAEYRYEQTTAQFTRTQMDIVYSVTQGFYSLHRAERQREIAAERLKNSEESYRVAKLKFETGRIPEGEVLIAEVEMSRNRAALLEVEGTLEREREEFLQQVGLEPDAEIKLTVDLHAESIAVEPEKALEEALRSRPEIQESEMDRKLQEINLQQAERERELKGEVSAYYDITGVSTLGEGNTGDLFQSSFDNFVDRPPNRGVSLTFSYPVFDWGRGAAMVEQQRVLLKEKTLRIDDRKRTIIREVRDVIRRVDETSGRLVINEKNEQVARRSYDISRMRFENGDFTSQELAREQERLASAQLDYLTAFIDYQLALADLKRKTMWDFEKGRSMIKETGIRDN